MNVAAAVMVLATLHAAAPRTISLQDVLPDKSQRILDQALVAYQTGQLNEFVRLAGSMLDSLSPDELRVADAQLRARYDLDRSLVDLTAEARVELVLDGQVGQLRRPGATELPVALVALDDRTTKLLDPVRRELDIGFPALVPDDVLNEKVPVLAALSSQLEQAALLSGYVQQLVAKQPAVDRAALQGRAREIANRKSADEQRRLDGLRNRLNGRLIEFNIVRLNNAAATLANETANFNNRFVAAIRAQDSLATIHANWDRYKAWKKRDGTYDATVEARWRMLEPQVRARYADLNEKVLHFTEGQRLWLMGRYGRGPVAGGLARASRLPGMDRASQSARMAPVLMPAILRKPEDPQTVAIPYPVARRHHEWWRYPVDASQLIGYAEYTAALGHFEQLIQSTSPAERRVLEEMIGDDDRFVVHSALSSRFDALEPASTLRIARRPPHPKAARPHERRGLSWAMAHARIELEAMRTIEEPGGAVLSVSALPTPFEEDAYLELLLDSVREHYFECLTENLLRVNLASTRLLEPQALPRLAELDQKLTLALSLTRSLRMQVAGRLTLTQENELDQWVSRLLLQQALARKLLTEAMVDGVAGYAGQIEVFRRRAAQAQGARKAAPNQNPGKPNSR
jgi:hypothetical protein